MMHEWRWVAGVIADMESRQAYHLIMRGKMCLCIIDFLQLAIWIELQDLAWMMLSRFLCMAGNRQTVPNRFAWHFENNTFFANFRSLFLFLSQDDERLSVACGEMGYENVWANSARLCVSRSCDLCRLCMTNIYIYVYIDTQYARRGNDHFIIIFLPSSVNL